MKPIYTLLFILVLLASRSNAQYNTLPIPDTVVTTTDLSTGKTVYSLEVHEALTQILPSPKPKSITNGYNTNTFLGPTLIMYNGTDIQMAVKNNTNEGTTVHWHGIHLPPVMDGGPYQIISTGSTWKPYWKVDNNASTYWYHAHMHMETDKLVSLGQAGLLIIKDSLEATLPLPRTYGVDDIPLILTDRQITDSNGKIEPVFGSNYEIVNGVLNASVSLPAQVVRFRILNASTVKALALGLSTTDTISIIGSDGGLLDAPVKIAPGATFIIAPSERYEILLNLTGKSVGATLDLVAYNSTLSAAGGVPGGPPIVPGDSLKGRNFNVLHMVVAAPTSTPVTSIPATLTTNTYPDASSAVDPQTIEFTYHTTPTAPDSEFSLNDRPFQMGVNTVIVPLDAIEKWTIVNKDSNYVDHFKSAHVFHIHDIEFHVLSITDTNNVPKPIPPYQQGWKDVMMVDYLEKVTFITHFKNFADPLWPYMYHCHMLPHEDHGMMGQFIVVDKTGVFDKNTAQLPETAVSVYPNPAADRLHIDLEDKTTSIYYLTIYDAIGRKIYMLPKPIMNNGLDISMLGPGQYSLKIMDTKGSIGYKKFVKL